MRRLHLGSSGPPHRRSGTPGVSHPQGCSNPRATTASPCSVRCAWSATHQPMRRAGAVPVGEGARQGVDCRVGHHELVVLAARQGVLEGGAGGHGHVLEGEAHPRRVGQMAEVGSRPSETSIMACAPARRAASPSASRARGRRWASSRWAAAVSRDRQQAACPGRAAPADRPTPPQRARQEEVVPGARPAAQHGGRIAGDMPVTVTATTSSVAVDRSPPTTGQPWASAAAVIPS